MAKCLPPIIAMRTTLGMHGKRDEKSPEVLAAEEATRQAAERVREAQQRAAERERAAAERVREAQGRVADAERAQADIARRLAAETEAREAAEQTARDAQEKAARASARRAKTHTDSDGDAGASGKPAVRQVRRPAADAQATVTHDADASAVGDAPGEVNVTHEVTQTKVTHPGDGDEDGASLTREERMTLAVMEVLNDASVSARAAALKHDVDPRAVQRRVSAARQQTGGHPVAPLRGAAVNGQQPNLNGNQ